VRERLKEPRKGSEIDPETLCLQRVGARKGDGVPFGEGTNDLRIRGKVKADTAGAVGKPSLHRANQSRIVDPKPVRATHGQAEGEVQLTGGPNQLELQVHWMSCE